MKSTDVKSAADFLNQHDPEELKGIRQQWEPESRTLLFGCGNGTRGIFIDSKYKFSDVIEPFPKTRLTREMVLNLQQNPQDANGLDLVGSVRNILDRYIHFPEPSMSLLVSLWVIGTYMYTMFGHYGYLFIYSSLKRSGKTRSLEILQHLAFEATTPLNAPTVPAMREMATGARVVLLDTLERWRSKNSESFAAAMELLDAGFRNGGTVAKMVQTGDEWRQEDFPVYSPYALAAINRDSLADTAIDRSFVIQMRRKDTRIRKARYEFHRCNRECEALRLELYRWALANAERVYTKYQDQSLVSFVSDGLGLNDRAADVWLPIFALAETLDVPRRERPGLEHLAVSMGIDPDRKEDMQRLKIIRGLTGMCDEDGIVLDTTESVLDRLARCNITADRELFHEVMGLIGIEQTSNRIEGKPRRSWCIPKSRLIEAETELTTCLGGRSDYTDYAVGLQA